MILVIFQTFVFDNYKWKVIRYNNNSILNCLIIGNNILNYNINRYVNI